MPQNTSSELLMRIEKDQEEAFFVEEEGICILEYVRMKFLSYTQKAAKMNQFDSSLTVVLVLTPKSFIQDDFAEFN